MLGKVVATIVLALSLQNGCDQGGGGGGGGGAGQNWPPYNQGPANVHCSVWADYPHQSSGSRDWIDGKVWVTCTGAAIDALTIEAKLQRRDSGEWHDLPSQWAKRWDRICDRLINEATRRGGACIRHNNDLRLHAPAEGTCLRVVLLEAQSALVELCGQWLPVTWRMEDDNADATLEAIVTAVMDGHVTLLNGKVVHVSFDGGYLGSATEDGDQLAGWRAER